jgi:hypothetical protein
MLMHTVHQHIPIEHWQEGRQSRTNGRTVGARAGVTTPRTLYDKIVDAHTVRQLDDSGLILLYVDRTVLNEYTSPQAFSGLRETNRTVWNPNAALMVVDHVNSTAPVRTAEMPDEGGQQQVDYFGRNARDFGIELFDILDKRQGIEHVVAPEQGLIMPGMVVAAGARFQQPIFEKLIKQQAIIKYQAGAGGAQAWSQLNSMPGDGYTIMGTNLPHIVLQPIEKDVGYKTNDLVNVHFFHYTPDAIFVPADSKFKTLQELIDFAKKNPGQVTFAGSGSFTSNHLAQQRFDELAGIKTTYVPFAGSRPSISAVLGNQVTAGFNYSTTFLNQPSKVRMLARRLQRHAGDRARPPARTPLRSSLTTGAGLRDVRHGFGPRDQAGRVACGLRAQRRGVPQLRACLLQEGARRRRLHHAPGLRPASRQALFRGLVRGRARGPDHGTALSGRFRWSLRTRAGD